jgi:CheY-like chemotaxis protein
VFSCQSESTYRVDTTPPLKLRVTTYTGWHCGYPEAEIVNISAKPFVVTSRAMPKVLEFRGARSTSISQRRGGGTPDREKPKSSVRVLIVDNHAGLRKAMRLTLEGYRGLSVAGEANDGIDAIRKVGSLKPHLVIMDVTMPELSGLAAAAEIIKTWPGVRIIIFSMHAFEEFVEMARESGVHGFVAKTDGHEALMQAIDTVLRNQTFFRVPDADVLSRL